MEGPSTLMFALGCMAAVRKVGKDTTDGCGFQKNSTPSHLPCVRVIKYIFSSGT